MVGLAGASNQSENGICLYQGRNPLYIMANVLSKRRHWPKPGTRTAPKK